MKIELGRQGKFILGILLIHFVFFGYLSNLYQKTVGEKILFLYQIIFDPASILSAVILFAIVFFMVVREKFFEYGIRNSIWLTPIIMIESWIWYWFINGFDITIIGQFFSHYEGYLTILSILCLNLLPAILAAITRIQYDKYFMKIATIK